MSTVALAAALAMPVQLVQAPREAVRHRRTLTRLARAEFGPLAPVPAFAAQIHQESAWRADARSWVGASGLTQFMPATAQWIVEQYPDLGPVDVFNPRWSMRAMLRYDKWLWRQLPRALDDCEHFAFVLASYNGGLGWTRKRMAMSPTPTICLGATCRINPGIKASNQRQNEEYSERVLFRWQPVYSSWGRTLCIAED